MAFTRTKSGLSNLAQFHGADVILFTEGGVQSFTFEDVCNGRFNEAAIDIKFWSAIYFNQSIYSSLVLFKNDEILHFFFISFPSKTAMTILVFPISTIK